MIFKDKNLFQIFIDLFVIPADKANHFFYGAVLFTFSNFVYLGSLAGLLVALFFAIGKELYDQLYGKFDVNDILWTMFGAGVACFAAYTGFYW
jgi:hypothetical protein